MRSTRKGSLDPGITCRVALFALTACVLVGCGGTARPLSPTPAAGLVAEVGDIVFQLEDPIIPPARPTRNAYGVDLDTRGSEIVIVRYSGVSDAGEALFTEQVIAKEWSPAPGHKAYLTGTTLGDREGRTRDDSRTISVDLRDTRVLERRKVRVRIHSADSRRLVYDLRDVLWD